MISNCLLLLIFATGVTCMRDNLTKELLSDYNKLLPPYQDGVPVPVNVATRLTHLRDVEQAKGVVIVQMVITTYWSDSALKWDPQKHHNLTKIRLDKASIWYPPIGFFTYTLEYEEQLQQGVSVQFDGKCRLSAKFIVTLNAYIDIQDFPFDKQLVRIRLGASGYTKDELAISLFAYRNKIPDFNNEWSIPNFSCEAENDYYNYSKIDCNMTIKRRPGFYILNFVVPATSVCFMSIISVNWDRSLNEKKTTNFQYALTGFMAISVLTLAVSSSFPRSSTLSRFHVFYFGLIALVILSALLSWITVRYAHDLKLRKKVGLFLQITEIILLASLLLWFCLL